MSRRADRGRVWSGPGWRSPLQGLVFALGCAGSAAADGSASPASVPALQAQVADLQAATAACAKAAEACAPDAVPSDGNVGTANGQILITWGWLREAFAAARKAKPNERAEAMGDATAHLAELAAQVESSQALPAREFRRARSAADNALARDEFRATEEQPTWLDRQYAHLQDLFFRAFFGLDRLGQRAPWLGPLIEWSCFLLAAAGLIYFVRGSLQRAALRVALGEGAPVAGRTARDATDWRRLAGEFAASGDWREAVHALYWAAISSLEGRRAWRPNAARTPREYVRLLSPGSVSQRSLRALTGNLEAIWYGGTGADEGQYRAALGSFEALEAADLSKPYPAPQRVNPADARPLVGGA